MLPFWRVFFVTVLDLTALVDLATPADLVVPADFAVLERDRPAPAVGVFAREGAGDVARTEPDFVAVSVVWLSPRLFTPRSDRVGLDGIRPLATGVEELRLTPRPTFSTEKLLLRLFATLTRFPASSSLLESSPPRRLPAVNVLCRLMFELVRVCQAPPLLDVPYGGESLPDITEPSRRFEPPLKNFESDAMKPFFFGLFRMLDESDGARCTAGLSLFAA